MALAQDCPDHPPKSKAYSGAWDQRNHLINQPSFLDSKVNERQLWTVGRQPTLEGLRTLMKMSMFA